MERFFDEIDLVNHVLSHSSQSDHLIYYLIPFSERHVSDSSQGLPPLFVDCLGRGIGSYSVCWPC